MSQAQTWGDRCVAERCTVNAKFYSPSLRLAEGSRDVGFNMNFWGRPDRASLSGMPEKKVGALSGVLFE